MIRHVTQLRVRYAETDQMGVTWHGRYLEYFEQARTDMLRPLGLPYAELERQGTILPVVEAHVRYLRGSTYDDLLEIEASIIDMPAVRMRIEYVVRKHGDPEPIAEGYTVHVFVNSTTGRPIRMPQSLRTIMERELSEKNAHA